MKVISSRDTLATIPAVMARAVRAIAEREGISAAGVIKRLLRAALVAESELPRPTCNDPVLASEHIDTGVIDELDGE